MIIILGALEIFGIHQYFILGVNSFALIYSLQNFVLYGIYAITS